MQEIEEISLKYETLPLSYFTKDSEDLKLFSILFSKDLAEFIDILARSINFDTRKDYYDINEATIVGLITKVVKYYNEALNYYETDKLDILGLFTRPIYESFILIKYLTLNGSSSQKNFRLVSYNSRYKNYKKLIHSENIDSPIIQRQLIKLLSKLNFDDFTIEDLELEDKKNNKQKWKIDGKTFWDIHNEVDNSYLYSFMYGGGSDFIHGNWQEIMDFHLTRKGKGYIGFFNFEKCDCRIIVALNGIILEAIREFLKWNNCLGDEIDLAISKMTLCNKSIYLAYEMKFGESIENPK